MDDNVVYHSLLGIRKPQELGDLSEMPIPQLE